MCALPVVRILTPGDQSGIDNHRDGKHIWRTTREIVRLNGVAGLWRGTTATLLRSVYIRRIRVVASISHAHICSNVPGVALYFTGLNQFRTLMATSRYFASVRTQAPNSHGSTLPKLTMQGNLLAGATTRVTVGLALNPFSVLKARYEVSVLWLLSSCIFAAERFIPSPAEQFVFLRQYFYCFSLYHACRPNRAFPRRVTVRFTRCPICGAIRRVLRVDQI